MTATTDRCPGCGGSGMEPTGVTYAGMSEYVGCHECGPECPDDCGCRVDAEPERPESIAPRHPGATQSPDGSQGATEGLRGAESALARTAVPRLLALTPGGMVRLRVDRERLTGEASRVPVLLAEKAALMGDADRLEREVARLHELVGELRGAAAALKAENARLREGIEALAAEMQSDTCPACHAFYADEGSTTWGCDHTEGMQHAGDMLRALLAEGGE